LSGYERTTNRPKSINEKSICTISAEKFIHDNNKTLILSYIYEKRETWIDKNDTRLVVKLKIKLVGMSWEMSNLRMKLSIFFDFETYVWEINVGNNVVYERGKS